jgi:hypothetical protein
MKEANGNLLQNNQAEEVRAVNGSAEMYHLLMFRVYEKNIQGVWKHFKEYRIEPILIKGYSAALNYPEPHLRPLGDIDLAVNPKHFARVLEVNKRLKMGEVDLHKGLRHLDTLSWSDIFENSKLIRCGQTNIRILRPEDHLRVLCVHWLNDGGINKEKLWDIYYAVKNRGENFDWERCLETVSRRRRKWVICAIGAAHKYLALEIADTPLAEEAKQLPAWMIQTIEKEWNSPVKFKYLHICLRDRKEFLKQLGKRIPPNPIQATIEMEGEFDNRPRIFYQTGGIFLKLKPSLKRVTKSIIGDWREKRTANE